MLYAVVFNDYVYDAGVLPLVAVMTRVCGIMTVVTSSLNVSCASAGDLASTTCLTGSTVSYNLSYLRVVPLRVLLHLIQTVAVPWTKNFRTRPLHEFLVGGLTFFSYCSLLDTYSSV